jgi:CBS domain-containing protein
VHPRAAAIGAATHPRCGFTEAPAAGRTDAGVPPRGEDGVDAIEGDDMRVANVMTTEVLTVRPETTLKEVAELLSSRGISGMPVVDEAGNVLGVVSEADVLAKERRPRRATGIDRLLGREPLDPKMLARTAGEAMTSPAVTIDASRRVDAAAALMLDHGVNRLPVVDSGGLLVGIVTRADLVRAFVHTDEEIAREIREDVLLHDLWLDPVEIELAVVSGEVTVSGRFRDEAERELLVHRIRLVPGVVSAIVTETAPR